MYAGRACQGCSERDAAAAAVTFPPARTMHANKVYIKDVCSCANIAYTAAHSTRVSQRISSSFFPPVLQGTRETLCGRGVF